MLSNLMTSDKKTTEESDEKSQKKSKKRKKQRQIQIFFYLVTLLKRIPKKLNKSKIVMKYQKFLIFQNLVMKMRPLKI